MEAGWLGLGAMGLPTARRLADAGHRVTAFDPEPGRSPEVGGGVVPAGSAAEAVAAARS